MTYVLDTTPVALPRDDQGRVLGLRRDLENRGDLVSMQSPAPRLAAVDIDVLPNSLGVADWMQIENQANQGSCQGHAQSSCLELSAYHQTKKVIQYNRQFAYLATQKLDGIRGDNGSTMTGGAKSAMQNGIPLEETWPYSRSGYPRGGYQAIPAALWEEAKKTTLVGYRVLESAKEVLEWLANGVGGVAIGIDWNGSCSPNSKGQITSYRFNGGGHALGILDWIKEFGLVNGLPWFDMFNSWGEWGYKGRAFIHPEVMDLWCKRAEVLGYGVLKNDDFQPQEFDWLQHGFVGPPPK